MKITINGTTKDVPAKKAGWAKAHPEWYYGFSIDNDGDNIPLRRTQEQIDEMTLAKEKENHLKQKISELSLERDSRVGSFDLKSDQKNTKKYLRLLRKESKGNASQVDINKLEELESSFEFYENVISAFEDAKQYLDDQLRSIEEIVGYDVKTTPAWP